MMFRKLSPMLLTTLFVVVLVSLIAGRAAARPRWQQKVDAALLETMVDGDEVSYLVILEEQADLKGVNELASKEAKGKAVYARLTEVAQRTQEPLIKTLQQAGAAYRPYWISNMILARGDAALVEKLARRSDVARIHANPQIQLDVVSRPMAESSMGEDAGIEWNIDLINAPDLWAAGIDGRGAVIGGQDTGYDWTHPALKKQYRGWDGEAVDHNYNWHDAIHDDSVSSTLNSNACGYDSHEPCDDHGHGTHTMGTIVGDDGVGNQIGVAPGAQWIGCRNMENGVGTPATYAECYEWFAAPYPVGGDPFSDGDPAQAPHAINNSWSCPVEEGCTDPKILRDVVENVRASGIVTVHSASNKGYSGCGSIAAPAANYDASFTVGAADKHDMIAGFSSRGPAGQDDTSISKPDVTAPGVNVRSSTVGDSYGSKSGTSMAAPHVAGLVALLVDAGPFLAGDVDLLESIIAETSVPLLSSEGCGGDAPDALPNNTYGWGRIDALAAYEAVQELHLSAVFTPLWLAP